jgi:FO synthase subunit 1
MMEVTYSRNVFIPLSNACRNACAYCGFRSNHPEILPRHKVRLLLEQGAKHGCKEALFTLGEKPESHPKIAAQLKRWGYADSTEYLYELCHLALKNSLLPHSNPGVIGREELRYLGEVNASMGLMLENSSPRLLASGMPHHRSPGKEPTGRLRMIAEAGKLKIPFTTGLLIGIGETYDEVQDSLRELAEVHARYGHIQEIIIQNFKPKKGTPMASHPEPSYEAVLMAVKSAKKILPGITLQVPPNLNPSWPMLLSHGVSDLGGISPVTRDYINPEDAWPRVTELQNRLHLMGHRLRERLPIYPPYIFRGWFSEKTAPLIFKYIGEDGLVECIQE